ncbi:MAG: hypothetical protein ACI4VF_00845 [Lachnospirales bacterium]
MDFKNIKELIIKKCWEDADDKEGTKIKKGRYGDDYRSLSKQIDNFLNHIKKRIRPYLGYHWRI